jgi:pimeloyl-ACP methyl ester carboxylesterase
MAGRCEKGRRGLRLNPSADAGSGQADGIMPRMDMRSNLRRAVPALEPYDQGMLELDDVHTMYWETCGNPLGVPVLFLHGGPGGGCSVEHRRFFDPEVFRVVLFDQRGAGNSTPLGEAPTTRRATWCATSRCCATTSA